MCILFYIQKVRLFLGHTVYLHTFIYDWINNLYQPIDFGYCDKNEHKNHSENLEKRTQK